MVGVVATTASGRIGEETWDRKCGAVSLLLSSYESCLLRAPIVVLLSRLRPLLLLGWRADDREVVFSHP